MINTEKWNSSEIVSIKRKSQNSENNITDKYILTAKFIMISLKCKCFAMLQRKKNSDSDSHMSRDARKPVFGVLTRSETNQPVQSLKQARTLKSCTVTETG